MILIAKVALLLFMIDVAVSRSFNVDYDKNCFLKDGSCFRYISGTIHYFKVPNQYWKDRLEKMKMAGINALQTYVEWNRHEPEPGVYNFEGDNDLFQYLKIAQDLGFLIILRPGPFIDAERDMGGLPYWLLREKPDMKLRSMDETYLKYMERWFTYLLPKIEPLLYNNGGPIISVQIENEYGFYGCEQQYKSYMRDLFRRLLKNNVVLFTTDGLGSSLIGCGKIDGVLSTVDFGAGGNVKGNFEILRWTQSTGPLVNSEFYPGWLDHWGHPHAQVSTEAVVKTLTDMLELNASVNLYPFHGGTSFGFAAGSNLDDSFKAVITSYDFEAPLDESGDPTDKYFAVRDVIGKYFPLPPGPLPKPTQKLKSAPITLKKVTSLWDYVATTKNSISSPYPQSFESISHPYGFVLYSTSVQFNPTDPALLTVKNIADRGHVYVNKVLQGILSREQSIDHLPIKVLKGDRIDILVENQGRICFGSSINDKKGIYENVTLGSQTLLNWTMTPVLLNATAIKNIDNWSKAPNDDVSVPSFYTGTFSLPKELNFDSYLKLDGWHKGVAFLNTFNLGRYWPVVGPQVTLYTPSIHFKTAPDVNQITLLELENAPCGSKPCTVQFVETPILNGTSPN